jgi:rRNA small subunit pseudouridine methyltransferase Nep1
MTTWACTKRSTATPPTPAPTLPTSCSSLSLTGGYCRPVMSLCVWVTLGFGCSPLNKAGLLQVFMQTKQNVLIEINPQIRIPRTYKRFAGLIVQLLHKMKIKASSEGKGADKATEAGTTLMKVIKNPVTAHLPPGAPIIGADMKAELIVPMDLVPTLPDGPVVFVFGAMAHGFIKAEYIQKNVSFSRYPLSAATAIARLLGAVEFHWGIA